MSKLTESLDQIGEDAPAVSSWAGELFCSHPEWQTKTLKACEERESITDLRDRLGIPPTLAVRRDEPPFVAQSYRGHRYWVVGSDAQECERVMPLLEEFSLRDLRPPQQARLIELVRETEKETGIKPFEQGWNDVVSRIGRALETQGATEDANSNVNSDAVQPPKNGLAFLDATGNAAVWAPAASHALVVFSGGGASLAAWTDDPITTLHRWIDDIQPPQYGCTRPD